MLSLAIAYKDNIFGTRRVVDHANSALYEFAIAHQLITEDSSNQYLGKPFVLMGPRGTAVYASSPRGFSMTGSPVEEYQQLYLKYKEELDEVIHKCGLNVKACHPHVLAYMNMISVAKTLPIESRLALINGFVNYFLSYDESEIPRGMSERYTLAQTIMFSGSVCDRNAMLKVDALARAGVPEVDTAWISTYVYDNKIWPSAGHAVVLVRINGEDRWILDNQEDNGSWAKSAAQHYEAFRRSSKINPDYAFLNTPDKNGITPNMYPEINNGVWQVPDMFFNGKSRGTVTEIPYSQNLVEARAPKILSLPPYEQASNSVIKTFLSAHAISKRPPMSSTALAALRSDLTLLPRPQGGSAQRPARKKGVVPKPHPAS